MAHKGSDLLSLAEQRGNRIFPYSPTKFFFCMPTCDRLFKKKICAWSEHFIRSEPKTALFGSRPLKESSGRAQILAEKGDWRRLLALLIARGENRLFSPEEVRPICFCGTSPCSCPLSPFRFFLQPTAGERVILSLLDSFPHKSFACGERRSAKQNKSRLAAGVAPVQVASLSVFGNYKNSSSFLYLYSE